MFRVACSRVLRAIGTAWLLAACGGTLDEPAPSEANAGNRPSNAPAPTGCAAACERLGSCATPLPDPARCKSECERDFPDARRQAVYASCIQRLTCDAIDRGLGMGFGPIGACYAEASTR